MAALLSLILAFSASGQVPLRKRLFTNGFQAQQPQPEDEPLKGPRLFWKNGEYLDGILVAADEQRLSFESALFEQPLQLDRQALARIEFPAGADAKTTPAFCLLLKNGDRFFTDLSRVSGDHVNLKSERHGELRIAWKDVQSIRRLKGGPVLYQGPNGADGWKHYGLRDAQGFPWSGGERGTMVTRVWNRSAMLELPLPDKVQVEIVLSSSSPLRFALCLGQASNSTQLPALETWQNDLVIAQKDKFTPVLRLADEDTSLALRLLWDRSAQKLQVHDWSGKLLAAFQAEAVTSNKQPCVLIRNKGTDLTLEHLCVRTWDGAAIGTRDVTQPSVETVQGQRLEGTVTASADGQGLVCRGTTVTIDSLVSYDAGPAAGMKLDARRTPLAQMLIVPPAAGSGSRARYLDGTVLTGAVAGFADGRLALRHPLVDEALQMRLDGMSRLTLNDASQTEPASDASLETMDTLEVSGALLHGTFEGTGDGAVHWRAPGAVAAVPVKRHPTLEIRRAPPVDAPEPTTSALFFLKDGNVVGAELREVDEKGVKFASSIAEATTLEASQLNAIHFQKRKATAAGFSDPSWQLVKGSTEDVIRTGAEKVLLKGNASLGHPSVLAGNEISFTLTLPGAFGALAMDLFAGDFETHTKGSTLHLIFSGTDFWATLESGDNNSRGSEQLRNLSGRSIEVRLQVSENALHVFANGLPLLNAELDSKMRKGTGLILSPSLMWGNPARDVEISNFQVKTRPDFLEAPNVSDETKRNVLTIPRFRRATPPTHVLLAPNGDVLRGRITSATENLITFASGLDELRVPMERVSTAIWLNPPKPADAATEPAATDDIATTLATHWLILQDGSRLGVNVDRFEKDHIVAWAPTLGAVKIPNDQLAVLKLSAPSPSQAMLAYQDWRAEFAPEPVLPESGGQASPLLGKMAPDFALPLLGGGQFSLLAEKGKVVVLDFWATWCGPCVISMPEQLKAIAAFDPAKVRFIAVNQGEPDAQVSRFLATRGWQMTVALDAQQDVGMKYGVEGIPHCVVIGPDGKVAWTSTGYTPGDSTKMAAAVKKLLEGG